MSVRTYNPSTGKWEVNGASQASQLGIMDLEGNFSSPNAEGALRELGEQAKDQTLLIENLEKTNEQTKSELETTTKTATTAKETSDQNKKDLTEAIANLKDVSERFDYHVLHHPGGSGGGGGGGGGTMPTITSTYDVTSVDADTEVKIPIFFTSPNLGEGTCYISINDIEIDAVKVKQGNNSILIGILPDLKNVVNLYVKDRSGLISNQLEWTIIKGGVELSTTFDSDVDYAIDDVIRLLYNVTSASTDPIILNVNVDGNVTENPSMSGYNEYIFRDLSVGVHEVILQAVSGTYKSNIVKFNLVIVNSDNLYISSTFKGGSLEYGVPLQFPYRISKLSPENFDVKMYIDNEEVKSLSIPSGSYIWTIASLEVGFHKLRIDASGNSGDSATYEVSVSVNYGDYVPKKPVEAGLIAWFDATERTNNDVDKETWTDKSGQGVKATLHNFNFYTNGWINNSLVCDSDSYVEIDMKPYQNNVKQGSTIEILYTPHNIGYENARVLDYTNSEVPYNGIYINIVESQFSSINSKGKVSLDEEDELHLTYVIDRINKFGKVFVNGILSRAFYLSDSGSGVNAFYEDFSHNEKIYLNCEKGTKNFGSCEIKQFRVYNRALDDDEILNNYIADKTDIKEQEKVYKFNYENKTTPEMRFYGDLSNMTNTQRVQLRIKYTSPNEELYGSSFDLPSCEALWQGTSSLQYVVKNYTIYLRDENLSPYMYTPYKNGILTNIYCMKCDYMESSHANNVGFAKFINESLYDSKNPAQRVNDKYRNTVNGFPVLLYINDEFTGVYNFNLDRYTTDAYGYTDPSFDKCLCYEVSANTDTTAGAFYKYDKDTAGKTEHDYYASDFRIIYPPSRENNDNFAEIKRLVEFVSEASDELFRDTLEEYFNLEYLLRYYLTVMVLGLVDSLGKNMKLTTWDGLIWYPQFYDLDTAGGLDNTGFLKYDMDIEVVPGTFNTSGSRLWSKLTRLYQTQLREEYAKMRTDRFTVENIMKYVAEEQMLKIPERYYNLDAKTKYLNFGPDFLYACHGSRYEQFKRWIRERIVYVDTLMGYYGSTSEYVTVRANKKGKVYIDLETYIPMYLRVKFREEANDAGTVIKKVKRNEVTRFEYTLPTETDQEIIIYASRYLKSMGDITNLSPTAMLVANATKLTSLVCTNADKLISADIASCKLLQHVDLHGCSLLGTGTQNTITVNNCKYLKTLNIYGTSLTAVNTSLQGGNLEEIYYPTTVQTVNLIKQSRLKVLGLPYAQDDECTSLATVQIEDCPMIERLTKDELPTGLNSFSALKYVQSLIIKNSMKLEKMVFDSFSKLNSLTLENLYNLKTCGFDNLNNSGDIGTLTDVTISNCPNVEELTFNVTSDDKAINFSANNSVINLTNATSIKSIVSNTSIKGLKTLILPKFVEDIRFEKKYGDGITEIRNLWSYSTYVDHKKDGFTGIDFKDLNVKNLDLTTCVYIDQGINFSATPADTLIFDKYRSSMNLPAITLNGTLDLSNYTGSYSSMFRNMDLTNLELQCSRNSLPQSDFSYMFFNSKVLANKTNIMMFVQKMLNGAVYNYMFSESDLDYPIAIPSTGNYSAAYMYEACNGFETLDNVEVNERCISAEGMFKKCQRAISANNMVINATGNLSELLKDCTGIKSLSIKNPKAKGKVTNLYSSFSGLIECESIDVKEFDISNVNTLYGTFDNDRKIKSIDLSTWEMGNVENISTMFQSCNELETVDFTDKDLRKVNTASYAFHLCYALTKVVFTSVKLAALTNIYAMFRMCTKLNTLVDFVIPETVSNYSECFTQCPLYETPGFTILSNILGTENGLFYGNDYIRRFSEITLGPNVTSLEKAFMKCRSLTEDIDIPTTVNNARDAFRSCSSMIKIHSNWSKYYESMDATNCYYGCNNISMIDDGDGTITNVPEAWGGGGILSILTAADIYLLEDLTGKTTGKLKMTEELKNSLTPAQIALITAKNWMII